MRAFQYNKVLRGTFGKVWVDGERMSNVKSFEAKVSLEYEDMIVNGDFGTKKRYIGYSAAGTMVLHKFDSFILKKYKKAIVTGDIPDMTIVVALDDPTAYGAERVQLRDITLDEVTLAKFENKTLTEEEVPFAAGSFEFLDLIE